MIGPLGRVVSLRERWVKFTILHEMKSKTFCGTFVQIKSKLLNNQEGKVNKAVTGGHKIQFDQTGNVICLKNTEKYNIHKYV